MELLTDHVPTAVAEIILDSFSVNELMDSEIPIHVSELRRRSRIFQKYPFLYHPDVDKAIPPQDLDITFEQWEDSLHAVILLNDAVPQQYIDDIWLIADLTPDLRYDIMIRLPREQLELALDNELNNHGIEQFAEMVLDVAKVRSDISLRFLEVLLHTDYIMEAAEELAEHNYEFTLEDIKIATNPITLGLMVRHRNPDISPVSILTVLMRQHDIDFVIDAIEREAIPIDSASLMKTIRDYPNLLPSVLKHMSAPPNPRDYLMIGVEYLGNDQFRTLIESPKVTAASDSRAVIRALEAASEHHEEAKLQLIYQYFPEITQRWMNKHKINIAM